MNIAELNVGYARYPLDDPRMAGFMDNLDRINALAERSPGFVWRMQSDGGNATDIAVPGDADMISNLSVWTDVPSLGGYVFNTVHARFYEKRPAWFGAMTKPHFVMWHVADGHIPTLEEAMDRLAHLRAHGSTDHAFGWDAVDMTKFRPCLTPEEAPA
ncbi:DUF3291 domain-containing protein [Jannaschia sp. S6380]|uniref:DUF3291 domain-containing protein n=1 Tax=Jannaschia sp. S6380 TaxID=2926408 RepID=UPI001FF62700|nr:DUF3291 domain-containing protein [Jannaschia sp. S6380]MCK0168375.1 DUF3291 domain-containing protein [Jannaschia sp. S6380]